MTWFRVGGAGIPTPLKNAMNAVLNKKFGTSGQNYPPNGWPDNVNLMGPLPIKTASGAIASFPDGADDVPVVSCVCGIVASGGGGTPNAPVPIVPHSGMTVTRTDGQTPPVTSDTYTVSWSDTAGTIYGGELNITTGALSDYGYEYDLGSNNWTADPNRPGVFYSNVSASGREAGSNVIACDCFEVKNINVSTSYDNYISGRPSYGGAIIFIRCTDFSGYTGAQVKTALTGMKAYLKSSAAQTYQITATQINTLLGNNDIYADTGDTSVQYRADIDLALQAVSSSRGLMMASRPVTQLVGEQADLDQVNEVVENDEDVLREQLNEVVENDETEQEGEDDAR